MNQAQSELNWMLELLKPPYTEGWETYCEKKAEGLARKYPQEYADLPRLLTEAMRSPSFTASTAVGAVASPIKSSGSAEPA